MPRRIGVWIDHAQAHLVALANGSPPQIVTIASEIEHKHKAMPRTGRVAPGHLSGSRTKRYDKRREEEKRRFYNQVVKALTGAEEIVVMGPGVAKGELQKEIKRDAQLMELVISVEPADTKMTTAQLVAMVKKSFDESPLRGFPRRGSISHIPHELDRIRLRGSRNDRADNGFLSDF